MFLSMIYHKRPDGPPSETRLNTVGEGTLLFFGRTERAAPVHRGVTLQY